MITIPWFAMCGLRNCTHHRISAETPKRNICLTVAIFLPQVSYPAPTSLRCRVSFLSVPLDTCWKAFDKRGREWESFLTNPSVSPGSLNQVFKSPLLCQLTNGQSGRVFQSSMKAWKWGEIMRHIPLWMSGTNQIFKHNLLASTNSSFVCSYIFMYSGSNGICSNSSRNIIHHWLLLS